MTATRVPKAGGAGRTGRVGRPRDLTVDGPILDAVLAVLAETGYDAMTVDEVAARCGSARATIYRRWPTKSDLALAAISQLSTADAKTAELPDTGSFRGDVIAMFTPDNTRDEQLRLQVLMALLTVSTTHPDLASAATDVGIGPWIEANHVLITRAVDRGEFPRADVDTLATIFPMLCVARAAQHQPISREFAITTLDSVIIPALRGGPPTPNPDPLSKAPPTQRRHHRARDDHQSAYQPAVNSTDKGASP